MLTSYDWVLTSLSWDEVIDVDYATVINFALCGWSCKSRSNDGSKDDGERTDTVGRVHSECRGRVVDG